MIAFFLIRVNSCVFVAKKVFHLSLMAILAFLAIMAILDSC